MSLSRTRWRFAMLLALALWPLHAHAQEFEFEPPRSASDPKVETAIRDLAGRILPVYEDADQKRFLANLSALQLVGGDYEAADDTRRSLRERRGDTPEPPDGRTLLIDLYAHAKASEGRDHVSFTEAFTRSFRDLVPQLNDRDAYAVTAWIGTPLTAFEDALQKALDGIRNRNSLTQAEAIHLMWIYLAYDAYRGFGDLLETLGSEDDRRRYVIEDNVSIGVAGAKIRARVVRPKDATQLPALLEFTIFAAGNDARACAAYGYAGIVATTRSREKSPVPFDYDGEDARAVINWIAKQPWSDGRVGMYGDTYGAFAAWAAAKRAPPALKAIATLDAMAPGIDFPSDGRIFRNTSYRWAYTNTRAKPSMPSNDDAQWRELDQAWYRSGKPYRDLDRVAEPARKRNRIFQGWLGHPSYDRYWQMLIPSKEQFARFAVPVLAMAGYEGSAEVGSLYYFAEHQRHDKNADHTLLIGAHDDSTMLDGPSTVLQGHPVDSVAHLDLRELRFRWFDHLLKGAERPSLLKDRVNYVVRGANEWRHAPSLEAMANGSLKLYLDTGGGERHRLLPDKAANAPPLAQTVNLADRGDAAWTSETDVVSESVPLLHGAMFVSDPLPQATEVAGLLAGQLDFKVNKLDMDLYIALYEQQPGGEYLRVFDPYQFRASYAKDRTRRQLLRGGKRQQLAFRSEQVMSRRLQQGSRLVLVLGVNKRPDCEVNHGSGKAVSEESAADGKVPLELEWFADSYIDVPVRR